jgi:spore maturation protein CgeB
MSQAAAVNGSAVAPRPLRIVILGLSITSSWGNGHATTYRGLVRELCRRGHDVLFLECDKPWYGAHRDLDATRFGTIRLYEDLAELRRRWRGDIRDADLVIVGSYVPDGIAVGRWVREVAAGIVAFYDIDTPVTLAALAEGSCPYLDAALVPLFDLYLSFTGGPALRLLETRFRAKAARALYCSVDPEQHRPCPGGEPRWDLGYLGTYSADRQPALDRLLCGPARQSPERSFAVAGPLYPPDLRWPANLDRIEHVGPDRHPWFYAQQRFTLNVTRADMVRLGYSPSVRLFEAAACGVPIISDWWPGLATIFEPGRQILIAHSGEDVLRYLRDMPEAERRRIADAARAHVLAHHTAERRAAELEAHVAEIAGSASDRHTPYRSCGLDIEPASNGGGAAAFGGEEADAPPGFGALSR